MPGAFRPVMEKGGNTSVQTTVAGTTYATFPDLPCSQFVVVNDTGTGIEVQQDGAGVAIPIADTQSFPFYGIGNANQLGVRREDTSATQVTVKGRWEG